MRRLSFALTTLLLLSPLAASAAFVTPSALFMAMQNGAPRSFSLMAHADTPDNVYVSVWANGSLQGTHEMDMQLTTKATVDVVSGDLKARIKGEIMAVNGMLYLKITSVDTSMKNDFASLSANLRQHVWLKMPIDMDALSIIQNPAFTLSETDPTEADMTFDIASSPEKNGTTYTLTLKSDAAAQLALSLREMLNDTSTVSDDFFPWKALAEGVRFEMIVKTDASDGFISNSYSLHTKGTKSSFSLNGTEKITSALRLTAPADAMNLYELGSIFGDTAGSVMDMSALDMSTMPSVMEPTEENITFDSVDDAVITFDPSCEDSSISPLQKLAMQRDGTCPVEKTPTRYTR